MTAVSQMLRPNDRFITNLRMERCVGVIKICRPYGWGWGFHTARTDWDGVHIARTDGEGVHIARTDGD